MNEKESRSIINHDILFQIENHVRENGNLSLKLLGFADEVAVSGYSFPSSFDDDEARNHLKKLKYKNLLGLLNSAYKKMGISSLSKKEFDKCIEAGSEYWYLHISFEIPVPLRSQVHLKVQPHNFMFFLTNYEEGKNTDFKMMYSSELFFNYSEGFDRAIYLDFENPEIAEDEKYQAAISDLETVIHCVCKKIDIEIPEDLRSTEFDQLIPQAPTFATFESLIDFMTCGNYDRSEYKKDAKKLQECYKKGIDVCDMHEETLTILGSYEMAYYSDWKFDPEDIEYGISGILGEEFRFEYPAETYSHNLFPYIQSELAKQELTLMNIDTFGDSYLFFVVKIATIDRLVAIAQTIDLKIERI
jgi:hypothetical protein